jgi:RHS repeat-associated protein
MQSDFIYIYDCTPRFVCFADKFTGKERDTESNLDYFGARYYASGMGRFMSPDWSPRPASFPFADPNNPQSLNLYAYVNNNPLSHVDEDGHLWEELKNLWNWGHYVNNAGLNAALQNDADQARSNLSGMKGFTLNGQSPADFAKGANNQQAIRAEQTVVDFLTGKVMQSLMGGSNDPRIQVGIVFRWISRPAPL